jgi:hypothetical protein
MQRVRAMLHAFNEKNIRRVLPAQRGEHQNDRNEDAITSMVFSPLAFMTPADGLEVLCAVEGELLRHACRGRHPTRQEVHLWPKGLMVDRGQGAGLTSCEPDLVVNFDFVDGPPLLVIVEMKWAWPVTGDALHKQISDQRKALKTRFPQAEQIAFSVSQHRPRASGLRSRTWVDVHQAAVLLRDTATGAPAVWGGLIAKFLTKAEQVSFQGFDELNSLEAPTPPVFWKVA